MEITNPKIAIVLGQYTGIKLDSLPKKPFTVSEENINETLNNYQGQFSTKTKKDLDAAIENNDLVVFDFENWINGQYFPNSEVKDASVVIGSNTLIPGIEQAMIGLKRGPDQVIDFNLSEETINLLKSLVLQNYFGAETENVEKILDTITDNQKIEVHLDVKEIYRLELPTLDDNLAKQVGYDSLTDLKEAIKNNLVRRTEDDFLNQVMYQIVNNSQFTIPDELIKKEVDGEMANLVVQLAKENKSLEDYQKSLGFVSPEQFNEEFYKECLFNLKMQLVTLELINQEQINATDEEIEQEYQKIAKEQEFDLEHLKATTHPEAVKNQVMMQKLIRFLVDNNG